MHNFTQNLDSDEKIEWDDQPIQGLIFSNKDIFLIPFSILWCGFAIFWETSVLTENAPLMFKLWGIPFVVVGLYFVFGRFIYDSFKRSRMYYAVTNKRVIIKQGNKTESINRGKWPTIRLTEYGDGRGTISFSDSEDGLFSNRNMGAWNATPSYPCFFKINNAKKVYQKLCGS